MGDTTAIAWTTAALHSADLTESQLAQLWAYLDVLMLTAENTWYAHNDGLVSEQSWNTAKNDIASADLGFRAGRIWREQMRFAYDPDFVKQIDAELAGRDPDELKRVTQETLDKIRSVDRNEAAQPLSTTPSAASPSVPHT